MADSRAQSSRASKVISVAAPLALARTRALQALAQAMRSPRNIAEADELHVRRERTRLLAAFDANLVPTPRSSRGGLWLGAALLVVLLSLLATLALVLRPRPPPRLLPSWRTLY